MRAATAAKTDRSTIAGWSPQRVLIALVLALFHVVALPPAAGAQVEDVPAEDTPVEIEEVPVAGEGDAGPGDYSPPEWMPMRSGTIGCTFRDCGGTYHPNWAIDIGAPTGTSVYAMGAGQAFVVDGNDACFPNPPYNQAGNFVWVYHGNNTVSRYMHFSSFNVSNGQWVDENTKLGEVGNSGSVDPCSFSHLHFEVRTGTTNGANVSGTAVNPGQLRACHGSSQVTYPSVLGYSSWAGSVGSISTGSPSSCTASAPGAPPSVSCTVNNSGNVTVTWGAAATNGSAIDNYQVRYKINSGGTPTSYVTNGTSRSRTYTTLALGQSHYFQVRAHNGVGWGSPSSYSGACVPRRVPGAPGVPSGTLSGSNINLSWSAAAANGDAVDEYQVAWRNSAGASGTLNAGTATTDTLGSLTPDTTYEFQVRAENAAGWGPYSAWSAGVVVPPAAPMCNGLVVTVNLNTGGVPTEGDDVILGTSGNDLIAALGGNDVVCAGDGDDTVLGLAGNDVLLGEGGNDLIAGNAGSDIIDGGSGDDTMWGGSDSDDIAGGIGDDTAGGGSGIDVVEGQDGNDRVNGGSDSDTVLGNDGNDRVSGGGGDDTNVHGNAGDDIVGGNGGQDTIHGDEGNDALYGGPADDIVYGGPGNDSVNGNDGDDDLFGEAGDDSLNGGKGSGDRCDGGTEATTGGDVIGATCEINNTPTVVVPGAPTSVSAPSGQNRQASLTWTAPADDGGSTITSYNVRLGTSGTPRSVTGTSYTWGSLTNGTTYRFYAQACNVAGCGAWSAQSNAVKPYAVPSQMGRPGAASLNNAIRVTYSQPNNNGSGITRYDIRYNSTTVTASGLSRDIALGQNGTARTFQVRACNLAGCGTYSTASTSIRPKTITVARGGAAPAGFWYDTTVTGPPGTSMTLRCNDGVDIGFWSQAITIGSNGTYRDSTLCYTADANPRWVNAGSLESNRLNW